jgi:hypothetical protein
VDLNAFLERFAREPRLSQPFFNLSNFGVFALYFLA